MIQIIVVNLVDGCYWFIQSAVVHIGLCVFLIKVGESEKIPM